MVRGKGELTDECQSQSTVRNGVCQSPNYVRRQPRGGNASRAWERVEESIHVGEEVETEMRHWFRTGGLIQK